MSDPLEQMPERIQRDMIAQEAINHNGQLSVFTCPECGGVLWQAPDTLPLSRRARVLCGSDAL